MKIKSIIIFFSIVFILNNLLNMLMGLGQDITYIVVLSMVTTALFYFLMYMRSRWSK